MIEKVDEMIALAKEQWKITSCIISHDMASTKRLADRVGFLHEGKIIFMGTYSELLHGEEPATRLIRSAFHRRRVRADPRRGVRLG